MNQTECLFCHQSSEYIRVAGHLQCSVCGVNVEPCCEGQTLQMSMETETAQ